MERSTIADTDTPSRSSPAPIRLRNGNESVIGLQSIMYTVYGSIDKQKSDDTDPAFTFNRTQRSILLRPQARLQQVRVAQMGTF